MGVVTMSTGRLEETGLAARRLGVSPFRIRQLANSGTLAVALVTASGQRLFDPAVVEQLRLARERARENQRKGGRRAGAAVKR